jgi:hypothetical protein
MPSPVYQNMVYLIVSLSIGRCASKFMNVTVQEHCTFDSQVFGFGKVYCANSIIITNFLQTLIPNCWFEKVFSKYFGIEIS